ncbi:hypothetical protein [Nannocystis punicea]|uniref:Uncharacterized protein n=1 Tax=Nannocystis punicea TaxID=2995304 RepID=A0ABY7HC78_9BACT|nr:hypothetical protein [Nannocystis poenicansa]WAS96869.1 hypothetical protein O0S08_12035 [Nannocystis poenicansa]
MSPELARDGWESTREAGAIVLTHRERGQVILLGLAARLFDLLDGRRGPAELARLLEAVPEDIFCALDELADHGLLRARVSPPAAVRRPTRREVLGALVGVAAAGVTTSTAAAPPSAAPREAHVEAPAVASALELDDPSLVTTPPHEHLAKESFAKIEQYSRLFIPWDQPSTSIARAEARNKAEADLLAAHESTAKRADSPAEAAEKQRLEFPPELAQTGEAERKRAVAPLVAEEQAARRERDRYTRQLTGVAAERAAYEQRLKLTGEFGPTHEKAHKALLVAQDERRRVPGEQRDKRLEWTRIARWQADIAEGRAAEQDDKAVTRAESEPTNSGAFERAEARRQQHRAERLAEFRQRQLALARERERQPAQARTSHAAEQDFKARQVEQTIKKDLVRVELRACEHAAKSGPDPL